MQRPTNSWVALGRAGVSWWRKKNSLLLGYGEGTFCIIYFLVHMTITTLLMLSATQLIILNNMQMWWFSVCVFFKMHSAIVLGWEMSFQSSDWAHCAASVCVCVLMLNVYIGAWMIQSVPTKTDCLGTIPQRDALFKASHWPGNTFLYILPCSPQPLSQSLGDLIAELNMLVASQLQ